MFENFFKSYNEGKITDAELRCLFVRNITKDNVEEVLNKMPQDMLGKVKEHAYSDKPIITFCMGSMISRGKPVDHNKVKNDEYNRGLTIVREYLNHA
jgi:hypothetical protein